MGIKLHELIEPSKALVIEYEGHEINFSYRPGLVTAETETRLQAANAEQSPSAGIAAELALMVVEWDVMDDEGEPLPVTEEWMRRMPLALLRAMMEAIGADMAPNGTSASG